MKHESHTHLFMSRYATASSPPPINATACSCLSRIVACLGYDRHAAFGCCCWSRLMARAWAGRLGARAKAVLAKTFQRMALRSTTSSKREAGHLYPCSSLAQIVGLRAIYSRVLGSSVLGCLSMSLPSPCLTAATKLAAVSTAASIKGQHPS